LISFGNRQSSRSVALGEARDAISAAFDFSREVGHQVNPQAGEFGDE
jgi:hypothetical protein